MRSEKKAKRKRDEKRIRDDEGSVEAENCERFLTFFNVTHADGYASDGENSCNYVWVSTWCRCLSAHVYNSASMEW